MKSAKNKLDLKKEAFKRIEEMHPHMVLLYVSMIGSGIIFLFTVVAFTVSRPESGEFLKIDFPKSFIVSSLVMLCSSFSVSKVLPAFEKDDLDEVKKWLGVTLLLGLVFSAAQITGWRELQSNSIFFSGQRTGAYLYVISGLHVIHVLGVMIYLVSLLMECHKTSKDVVKHLLYATSPYQKIKFKILTDFWHFTDAAWIVLFFYFLFSF
ncbi:cytochrome c oxidase subunit 3 [Roseivirga sp. E12]|uniref:cytochrome c oxidase subunit 3 n=1 Tax=Roseivirga sp. E12 TaxID=2819237 RepID=UPI001ABC3F67|nr:cytochrome c oxidase subunit 3 [Roseivirga sp. E12]MBO3698773.1 cytochrome c oxidase subunit 3 [Roseivirga sp. E12]